MAKMFGVSTGYISRLRASGVVVDSPSGALDVVTSVQNYITRLKKKSDEDPHQVAKLELLQAQAARERLEFDKERAALCDVRQVADCFAELHRAHERAIAADKTGIVSASLAQARDDWAAACEKIIYDNINSEN